MFGECRFGFRQALRAWADAEIAKTGLRRAVSAMVRFEAKNGDARAAALLLSELDEKDPELEALVEAARKHAEEEAKKIEKLKELEKDLDPREDRQLRRAAGVGFGVFWTIVPLIAPHLIDRHPEYEGVGSIPFSVLCLAIMGIGHLRWPSTTRINRQLFSAFGFAVAAQPVCMLALRYLAHLPGPTAIVALLGYWFVVFGLISASIERRLAPLPIAYAIGFYVAITRPEWRYEAVAFGNLVAVLTVAIIWSRRGTELAIAHDKKREERGTIC